MFYRDGGISVKPRDCRAGGAGGAGERRGGGGIEEKEALPCPALQYRFPQNVGINLQQRCCQRDVLLCVTGVLHVEHGVTSHLFVPQG